MRIIKSLCYNKNMKRMQDGFSLVELALAMAFVGLLSLAVALVVNNAVTS